MYVGEHHLRLMRGVVAARTAGHEVAVWIVSAKHGFLAGDDVIGPYDESFGTVSVAARRAAYKRLRLGDAADMLFHGGYDVALTALGRDYAEGLNMRGRKYAAPAVHLTADPWGLFKPNYVEVPADQEKTRLFGCGNVALKGEMAGRMLERGVFNDYGALQGLRHDLSQLL